MPVPRVAELVMRGLAHPFQIRAGKNTYTGYRISTEGQRLIYEAMRRNALAAIERGEGDWQRPPSRQMGRDRP